MNGIQYGIGYQAPRLRVADAPKRAWFAERDIDEHTEFKPNSSPEDVRWSQLCARAADELVAAPRAKQARLRTRLRQWIVQLATPR